MRMHNPPHPGQIIRQLCLEPLGMSVTEAASALGVGRKTLSALLNGRAGISPEMAVRLSIAFGTSSESWMKPADAVRSLACRKASQGPSGFTRCGLTRRLTIVGGGRDA